MRLFTAIELPDDVRSHIDGTARNGVGRASHGEVTPPFVRPEILHITLTFLGEIADQDLPSICDVLRAIEPIGDLSLWADQVGCFPPRGPVRVVFVGLAGDIERLKHLHDLIERASEGLGYRREARPYTPHISVLRARPVARIVAV